MGVRALIKVLPDRIEGIPLKVLDRITPRELFIAIRNAVAAALISLALQADKDENPAEKPAKTKKPTPVKDAGKKDAKPSALSIFDARKK